MKRIDGYTGIIAILLVVICLSVTCSASGMDFTLRIFGNANGDMTIDQQDIALINEIISGKTPATELSDANHDGKVDEKDVLHVQNIIDGKATEMTVLDAYDKPVTIKTPVERIVSLDRMIAENAQVIGIGDKIVGIDKNTVNRGIILPEISKVTNVGEASEPDIEKIVSLKPGLVVNNQFFDEKLMQKMKDSGLTPLAMIYHGDIQNSLGYSKMLGYLAGSPYSANDYVSWMGDTLGNIHDKLNGLSESERTKVIYLYPKKNGVLGSGGKDCPTIKTLEFLGANTMTGDKVGSYYEIDPEAVIKKNPQAIVMEDFDTALGYGFTDKTAAQEELDKVKARAGFDKIDAVKNDKVYLLDVNIVSHSNCLGALYMAKALYPDKLADLDPAAIHQEYVKKYLKLPNLDVKKDGMFIFPEIS